MFDIRVPYGFSTNGTHCLGMRYTQLYSEYPGIEKFYFDVEKTYDPIPVLDTMQRNNYILPAICVVAYLLLCFVGPKVMAERKAFGLDKSLAAWNLFLAVFSAYGAIRTVPHMLHRVATLSFEQTVCEHPFAAYGAGACGLASVLFILSKIPELVDTVFIVLRKKPLIFLHWYHHVTVLIFCWNSYVTTAGAGLYFISMNYTVHAVMYFYFFMQAVKMVPRWFPSWLITLMQISQMVVGTGIVCASFYYYFKGGDLYRPGECSNQPSNLAAGGIIYASYLYLFVEFALKRFLFGEKSAAPKKAKKSE